MGKTTPCGGVVKWSSFRGRRSFGGTQFARGWNELFDSRKEDAFVRRVDCVSGAGQRATDGAVQTDDASGAGKPQDGDGLVARGRLRAARRSGAEVYGRRLRATRSERSERIG